MSDPALIVPVKLDVLVANPRMVATNGFRSWAMNYLALTHDGGCNSPEPAPFDADLGQTEAGVYLHWVLPEALRHGIQRGAGGPVTYPLVPNRWLVVRLSGEGAKPDTFLLPPHAKFLTYTTQPGPSSAMISWKRP